MRRAIAWGAAVFVLTVVLNLPAAFVARQWNWPAGWQPAGVSGSLWHGHAARLGAFAPLQWQVRPWAGEARLSLGFQQRSWQVAVQGWPWNWRATLAPGAVNTLPPSLFALDGTWAGRLQVSGAWRSCRSTEGELLGRDLALLSPWMLNLGNSRLALKCSDGLRLLADLQLPTEHRFNIEADLQRQRVQVDGQVEADAAVTPLLVQARWLQPPAQTFSKVLGKR